MLRHWCKGLLACTLLLPGLLTGQPLSAPVSVARAAVRLSDTPARLFVACMDRDSAETLSHAVCTLLALDPESCGRVRRSVQGRLEAWPTLGRRLFTLWHFVELRHRPADETLWAHSVGERLRVAMYVDLHTNDSLESAVSRNCAVEERLEISGKQWRARCAAHVEKALAQRGWYNEAAGWDTSHVAAVRLRPVPVPLVAWRASGAGRSDQLAENKWRALQHSTLELERYLQRLQRDNDWQLEHGWFAEGGVFELQAMAFALFRLAYRHEPKTVCEVGFNTGHSALLWLWAGTQHTQVLAFDIARWPYTEMAAEWINSRFPGRVELVVGNSTEAIPQHTRDRPGQQCDLVFVDGDHNWDVPMLDLQAVRAMSHSETLVLMDDVRCDEDTSYWCKLPTDAWQTSISTGEVLELGCLTSDDHRRGMCFGAFLWPDSKPDSRTARRNTRTHLDL